MKRDRSVLWFMDTKFVGDDIHRRRHDIFFVEDFEKVRNQRNVLCCEAAVFMCVCVKLPKLY